MSDPKHILRLIHRWFGLVGGLFVLFSCLTGATLVFHHELDDWLNQELQISKPGPRVAPEEVLRQLDLRPGEKARRLYFPDGPGRNFMVRVQQGGERRHLFHDGATGEMVGEADPLVENLIGLHRRLWMGDAGRWVITLGALMFLTSQFTGVFLGRPRRRKDWPKALTVSRSSPARFLYDLHRAVGYYTVALLCLIALLGLFFSPLKSMLVKGLYATSGVVERTSPRSSPGADIGLNRATEVALSVFPEARLDAVNLPLKEDDVYHFFLLHPGQPGRAGRSWVYVGRDGEVLGSEHALQRAWPESLIKTWAFPLHTGTAFGIVHQILWLVVVLAGASLPVTGFLMWLRKRRKKTR